MNLQLNALIYIFLACLKGYLLSRLENQMTLISYCLTRCPQSILCNHVPCTKANYTVKK